MNGNEINEKHLPYRTIEQRKLHAVFIIFFVNMFAYHSIFKFNF